MFRGYFVREENYLGVLIRNNGDDSYAIDKEMRSLYSRGNMICAKFKSCCGDVKRQLFISFCSSFHCCSLWSSYTVSSLRSHHVAHNNVFRCLFRLPRFVSSLACFIKIMYSFKTISRKLIFSLYEHVLIMALMNDSFALNSSIV